MATRGGFSSRLGFIAAAAGSAVGLGNIWGFPAEVGAGGGGAFVLMYLIFCFILCFPVMVTEIAIGRKTEKNPVGAFNALGYKKWNFVGKLGILSGFLILSFYNVIAGWAFGYIFEMATSNFGIAEQFSEFKLQVFKVGGYGLMFMAVTAYVVSKGISGGIEKAAKFLMPALIFMMLALIIYSFTLENSGDGLAFYLLPDLSKINGTVIYNALGQAFFSLSLGMGALITYGSYVRKEDNIVGSAALITLCDIGVAVLAGMLIFPLLGFITNGNIGDGQMATAGPDLIFVTLPQVFEQIGSGGAIVGAAFFILLCFAALTSTVSLLEVPVAYVVDEKGVRRSRAVWIVAGLIYLIGIPSLIGNGYSDMFTNFITYIGADSPTNFLGFIGSIANDSLLPLGGCLIVFFAAHVWKTQNLDEELAIGNPKYKGSFLQKYLNFAISYFAPFALGVIFLLTVLSTFFGINII